MKGDSRGSVGDAEAAGSLRVVLPAYNEEDGLAELLDRIARVLAGQCARYQVIVVDDGSHDGTRRVAEERARSMPIRIVGHRVNQGLGAALRDGLLAALEGATDTDLIVAMDADNTQPPELIPTMSHRIRDGADVVIASRWVKGARVHGVPAHRRLLSWGGSQFFRVVFPIRGVRDYTCGFRAYRARVLARAFERYGSDLFDQGGFQAMVDLLLKLRSLGLVFAEVPLVLRYDLKHGASKMKVLRTILLTLSLALRRRLGGRT